MDKQTTYQEFDLLAHILNIGRHMAGLRSLRPLLAYILDEVLALAKAETGYIILTHADHMLLYPVARDKERQDLATDPDMVSKSILQEVLQTNKPLVLSDAMQDRRFAEIPSVLKLRLRSVMCVPLITQSRTIGAVYVENHSAVGCFQPIDVIPLEILANQAAVAIENAILNDNLEKINQHLRQLDELKNNFIVLISHELVSPLHNLQNYAQSMQAYVSQTPTLTSSKVQETSQRLGWAVARLETTIQEIIQVFRIMSQQLDMLRTQVSVATVMAEVVAEFASVINERNLTLYPGDLTDLPQIAADSQLLRLVFTNVLSNAVKYTPDGGAIWINGRLDNEGIEIAIRDAGIGIPREEQKRVFDLFYSLGSLLHHTTSKYAFRGGGLGLGLPLAKGMVEAHGGAIWLESTGYSPDTYPGTTCFIWLPLSSTQLPSETPNNS